MPKNERMEDTPLILTRLAADEVSVNPAMMMRSSTSSSLLRPAQKGSGAMVFPTTSARPHSARNHQTNTTTNTITGPTTALAKQQRSRPSSASISMERVNKNNTLERNESTTNEISKPSAVSLRRQADLDMQTYVENIVQRVHQQRMQEQMRNKEIRKASIVCIQAWIRGFLVRRRHKGIQPRPYIQA